MSTPSSRLVEQRLRLALYGVRSSGKTCILSALTLSRLPHPEGLTCNWIENVPGHPLPEGDPATWTTNDPFHLGWRWISEQRERLKRGELPQPNPADKSMQFLFAFGSLHEGTRYIELIDYSGELITGSEGELAAQLREHMRSCDGLLVLAEVPPPDRDHEPLMEDLEKLKGAFLRLIEERGEGPLTQWPIAVLFNKWDRRDGGCFSQADSQTGSAVLSQLVDDFLNQIPPPPQADLINTLHNAVGTENVRCFPTSAFGVHQIRQGREVPVLQDGRLASRWLEDGFVWLIQQHDALLADHYVQAADAASWWRFWETAVGRGVPQNKLQTSEWLRRLQGVSPWKAILDGWKLQKRFPRFSLPQTRVRGAQRTLGLKLLSHSALFVLALYLFLAIPWTVWDQMNYRTALSVLENPSATLQELQAAEAWTDHYCTMPHYFSYLSLSTVAQLRDELRSTLKKRRDDEQRRLKAEQVARDDEAWAAIERTDDPTLKAKLAEDYLEKVDKGELLGRHTDKAKALVANEKLSQQVRENIDYLRTLEHVIDALRIDPTMNPDQLSVTLTKLTDLTGKVTSLPHPESSTTEIAAIKETLRRKIGEKIDVGHRIIATKNWDQFKDLYQKQLQAKNILEAARLLVSQKNLPTNSPSYPLLVELKKDFQVQVPPMIREKVHDAIKISAWGQAREEARIVEDRNVASLLAGDIIRELRKLGDVIDEAEDRHLYNQILRYRPQCTEQMDAYLSHAPLKTMQREVQEYRLWLAQLKEPLELVLTLDRMDWGSDYITHVYNYYNSIEVLLNQRNVIERSGVISEAGGRSVLNTQKLIRVKVDENILLNVNVKGWWGIVFKDFVPSRGMWTGTPRELAKGVAVDVRGNGFTNKAVFFISGIPPEPKLPEWSRRR